MGPARAHSKAKRAGNHSAVGRSLAACAATLAKTSLEPMNALEWRATTALSLLQALRMLGMFMILPVFELYARDLPGHVTPLQVGLAIGRYELVPDCLPFSVGSQSSRLCLPPVVAVRAEGRP